MLFLFMLGTATILNNGLAGVYIIAMERNCYNAGAVSFVSMCDLASVSSHYTEL